MEKVVFVFLATGIAMASAEKVCRLGRVEREEVTEPLETMWSMKETLNCSTENIDAATVTLDGQTYFFKDDFYWRMNDSDVDAGFPRLITQDWDGLPGNLDAALTWKDGRTFFFKGNKYWSFHGKIMDKDYPRNISEGFCGIPDNVDAALLWRNNRAYFFKGDQYWRFDGGESCAPVHEDYPMSIGEWKNIPSNVDAAVKWRNGVTYFLKGRYYYKYREDNRYQSPVEIHQNWGLKCSEIKCRVPISVTENEVETV